MNANEITIGTPCTINHWSDRDPAEVIEIRNNGKTLIVRAMGYKCISGSAQDGSAQYEYFSDEKGVVREFTLRKNGRYVRKGDGSNSGLGLSVGFARRYYDPHF